MVQELRGEALYGSELVGADEVPEEVRDDILEHLMKMRCEELRHFHVLLELWQDLGGEADPEDIRREALEQLRGRSGMDLVEALELSHADEEKSVELYESMVRLDTEDLPNDVEPKDVAAALDPLVSDERRHLGQIESLLERHGTNLQGVSIRGPESRLV